MLFGEGPKIKNIAADLNNLFRQGSMLNQSVQTVEGDSTADQGTSDLLAARDPVIQEISVGMSGEQSARYTVSGTPPLSLPNSLGKPLKAWSVDLLPKQDLHGYDSPWPAGGGVNKLDYDTVMPTIGFTQQSDGSWYTVSSFLVTDKILWENTSGVTGSIGLTYTFKYNSTTSQGIRFKFIYTDNTSTDNYASGIDGYRTVSFTSNPSKTLSRIVSSYGSGDIGTWIKDIQVNIGEAISFYPYSNLCPIHGTDKLNLFVEESYDPTATPKAVITLPSTVYTATIGSEGGESRWASEMFDGSADEAWTISGTGTYVAKCPTAKQNTVPISSTYPMESTSTSEWNIRPIGNNADFASVAEWKTYLAEHPMQVVYELATPTTFAVPSVTIPTPKGTATAWATAEDGTVDSMSVTYVGEA